MGQSKQILNYRQHERHETLYMVFIFSDYVKQSKFVKTGAVIPVFPAKSEMRFLTVL